MSWSKQSILIVNTSIFTYHFLVESSIAFFFFNLHFKSFLFFKSFLIFWSYFSNHFYFSDLELPFYLKAEILMGYLGSVIRLPPKTQTQTQTLPSVFEFGQSLPFLLLRGLLGVFLSLQIWVSYTCMIPLISLTILLNPIIKFSYSGYNNWFVGFD